MESIQLQLRPPDLILVVDGSSDEETKHALENRNYSALEYYKIAEGQEGLTKQRNFGISLLMKNNEVEIVCFLDDDTVLTPSYFENLISTYSYYPNAVGAGGYILEEVEWKFKQEGKTVSEFEIDGWVRKFGQRNLLRKRLGLLSDKPPGIMPEFSNGLSISFLPPSGKIYPVDFFMGGVSSWKKTVFTKIRFSEYFKGYGLYEDLEFCLRASELGELYVNTAAKLYHLHDKSGRPNRFNYGKMVIINGWYVWRRKFPKPPLKARFKWHSTAFLLTLVRLGNVISTGKRWEAFTEVAGRIYGWCSLLIKRPDLGR